MGQRFSLIATLLLASASGLAAGVSAGVQPVTAVFVDRDGTLDIENAVRLRDSFTPVADGAPMAVGPDVHWLYISGWSSPIEPETDYILSALPIAVKKVDLYRVEKDGRIVEETARVRSSAPSWRLKAGTLTGAGYYLRVHLSFPSRSLLTMVPADQFYQENSGRELLAFLCYGLVGGICLYSLFLFFSFRDLVYLFYAMMALCTCASVFMTTGASGFLGITAGTGKLAVPVGMVAISLIVMFAIRYLETEWKLPRVHQWLSVLVLVTLTLCPLALFLEPTLIFYLSTLFIGLDITAILFAGVLSWIRGHDTAPRFVLALVPVLVILPMAYQPTFAVLEFGWLSRQLPLFAVTVQLVVLAFALSESMNRMRINLRRNLEHSKEILEKRVVARTRQIEEQQSGLVEAARLAAVGDLAGDMAYEINNPLSIIIGFARRLIILNDKKQLTSAETMESAGKILNAAARITLTIKGLGSLAREADEDPVYAERVSVMVADALGLCRQRLQAREIQLQEDPIPAGLRVECRSVQICQVLTHLLNNAFEAVRKTWSPVIRVGARSHEDFVEIYVINNGKPIPPEEADRIFDPFFTNKDSGRGIGLGLTTSRTIAESHGGSLYIDREENDTSFVLRLPVVQKKPAEDDAEVA